MPDDSLHLDPLTWIVNVHWDDDGGGLHFLYSGADGMFGSEDGDEWKKLNTGAVPATGLAWVDEVWLAIGSGGPWRSADGGKTWRAAGAPDFKQIAACSPKTGVGIFAGYKQDEDGDNEEVYISRDLGKTWSKELTIPTVIPFGDNEDGYEVAQVLSGCGNGIFLSTIKGDTQFSAGDGCVYVSMNGGGFGGRQQIWSGTTGHLGDPPGTETMAYSAGAVGFDSKTKQFSLMAFKTHGFGLGGALGSSITHSIIYASGLGGSFSGENEIITYTKPPLVSSYSALSGGLAAAGGDGKFATTYRKDFAPEFSGELVVSFTDGDAETLISLATIFGIAAGSQGGPLCWKPSTKDESTDTPTGTGIFACVAFGVDAEPGGVWIDKADSGWQQTHSGQGFTDDPQGQRGGLAVGRLSWLGSDEGTDAGL